jgi:hypothetical protein
LFWPLTALAVKAALERSLMAGAAMISTASPAAVSRTRASRRSRLRLICRRCLRLVGRAMPSSPIT